MMTNVEMMTVILATTIVYTGVSVLTGLIIRRIRRRPVSLLSPDGAAGVAFDAAAGISAATLCRVKQWLADGANYKTRAAELATSLDAARLEGVAVIGMLERANAKINELAAERDHVQRALGMVSEELAKLKAELERERETAKINEIHPCRWYVFSGVKAAELARLWDRIPMGVEKVHEAGTRFWQTAHRLGLPDGNAQCPIFKSDGCIRFRLDPVYGQRETIVYYVNGK